MPVIFSTPTSHRVFMLDKDAAFMLKAMRTSGNIPGALFSEDIPSALSELQARLQLEQQNHEENEEQNAATNQDNDFVSINTKALPLVELLERAVAQNEKLLWTEG